MNDETASTERGVGPEEPASELWRLQQAFALLAAVSCAVRTVT